MKNTDELVFTPSAMLQLLSEIEELKDKNISLAESGNGDIQISIGESTYNILTSDATEVEVDDEVIEVIDQENNDTIEQLAESGDFDISAPESIESGILSGLVKSLLLGGMVRLAPKLLK